MFNDFISSSEEYHHHHQTTTTIWQSSSSSSSPDNSIINDPLFNLILKNIGHNRQQQQQNDTNGQSNEISSSFYNVDVTSMMNDNDDDDDDQTMNIAILITLSVILVCLILATIIGNVFVISAVILERSLRSVGNYLVVSLAITDLLVACLVMPIGAIYEVTGEWRMGIKLCELWTFIDVLCCTTSIFHLLAISCDRLWAVTTVDYIHRRKAKHVCAGITIIWLFSALISFGPMLGWKDNEFEQRIVERKECMISQDISYQIFATISSFYAPSILLLLQYYRIYQVAKARLKLKKQRYQHRIRRRPSFYRTRKESELKEFPRVTHRISINANEEFFSTSTAIINQPPPSSSISTGVYSSSTTTNTDYTTNTTTTNTTTNTTSLSNDRTSSIISISPPVFATLKPPPPPPPLPQTPEPNPIVSTSKRFSIVQFFHPQPVEQQFDDDDGYEEDDEINDNGDGGKFSMKHFDDYCDNNDLRSNETSIDDESTIIVGAERTSNIIVYVDDYGSTICSSCDPTENCSSGGGGNGISYYHHLDGQNCHFSGIGGGGGTAATAIITTTDQIDEDDEEFVVVENPFDTEIAVTIDDHDVDLNTKNRMESSQTPPPPPIMINEELSIEKPNLSESPLDNSDKSELRKISVHLVPPISTKEIENPPPTTTEHLNNQQQRQQQHDHHHHHRHKHSTSKKHKRRRIKKLKFKNKILRFDNNNNNNNNNAAGGGGNNQQQNQQESKAAKTLTIITGVFIICWLPFFVIALVMPLCGSNCYINKYLFDFFIWLGWANSTLNPFLYTIFSPDFRNAFKKLSKRIKG
ncbi:uncharacterized protein LOC124498878 [Dermatophagoides farinae]|uniref:uncharacterized protein LOC124498878 n=1 Tax=Dermatophagoides farinae TaxID=6954 RepID=UPI003F638A34